VVLFKQLAMISMDGQGVGKSEHCGF